MSEETSTTPPATTASGSASGTSGTGTSGNTGARRSNNRQTNQSFPLSNPVTFEGDIKEIGAVIGLQIDKFHKKVPFDIFIEKVMNYVITNFKNGGDLKPLFRKLTNPKEAFEKKHKIKDLRESPTDIDRSIHAEKIKQYIKKEEILDNNMEKLFGVVWGQCSTMLHTYLKSLSDFEDKADNLDVLWS